MQFIYALKLNNLIRTQKYWKSNVMDQLHTAL